MRLGLFGFGASATIALQIANYLGVDSYVVTRSASECERAMGLGATWAGTYDQRPPHLLDAAVTFAPAGDVVLAALRACERGATVAINAIHLDGIPAFDYADLWWERSLRSVANVTRDDVSDFLAIVGAAGIRTQAEAVGLDDAQIAFQRLNDGAVAGALVLVP
jgi:propanol-preferring alcohol dehydrogenase